MLQFALRLLAGLLLLQSPTTAPSTQPAIGQCLALAPVHRPGRRAMLIDPVEALIVRGDWKEPHAGEEVELVGGATRKWRDLERKGDGYADDALNGGWAYVPVDSPDERVVMLSASGHSMVYVNGEPRAGDVYENGIVRLPILLHAGRNHLLFSCGRGHLRLEIMDAPAQASISDVDATVPDFVRGQRETLPMAALVINPTTAPVSLLNHRCTVPPLSVRKIALQVEYDGSDVLKIEKTIGALDVDCRPILGRTFTLNVVDKGANRKRTYVSNVDDSVQYYSIVPPQRPSSQQNDQPALVLSLHGASVEATSQAGAYSSKSWAYIVCPTNRRPFGFDWEDWGRVDAIDVLHDAQALLQTDPSRVYLTGHSMGGHGAWQVGSTFPDLFAAVGPSAGWLSFATYRDATPSTGPTTTTAPASQPHTMTELVRRAGNPSDTPLLMANLAPLGVYILHGEDDDNVPFSEAQHAVKILSAFHHDFQMHAQPKAGHWWDASDEPGADCVDWAPMFDCFARHRLPSRDEVRDVDFRTFNPGVSSRCFWVTIDAHIHPLLLSHVQMRRDPGVRRFTGTTENVARLSLDLKTMSKDDKPIQLKLDDQEIALRDGDEAWLYRNGSEWKQGDKPPPDVKRAGRTGPFKQAFANHMVFVYGTKGMPDENAAAFNKARFDAETWWYRGNGSVDVIPDTGNSWRDKDRNVILYGNADTNAAWNDLLSNSPIQVRRGRVNYAVHNDSGDDLAAMFVYPRRGSDSALVGVIASTGPAGMRLTNRIPIFVSGTAMPDWIVFGNDRSARCGGFFDNNWQISQEDSVITDTSR